MERKRDELVSIGEVFSGIVNFTDDIAHVDSPCRGSDRGEDRPRRSLMRVAC